jgi:hypothetical protein
MAERRGIDSQAADKGFCSGVDARAEARFFFRGRVRVLTSFITHIFVVNEQKFSVGPFAAALVILDTEIRCRHGEVIA